MNDLLPPKGDDSLDKFCRILLKTREQRYIVKNIIKYEPTSEASRLGEEQGDTCIVSGSPSSSIDTRSLSSSHSGDKGPKRATFCFKRQHKKPAKSVIRTFCRKFFGINSKDVKFVFHDKPCRRGYLCYCDLQGKLVVLIVEGASPLRVGKYRDSFIGCIVAFLNRYKVKVREVDFREVRPGSSFIVLSMDFDSFVDLLCSLGQEERDGAKELGEVLQTAIPGIQKGKLYLGGLPAVEMPFSQPSFPLPLSLKQTETVCATLSRKVLVIKPCGQCNGSFSHSLLIVVFLFCLKGTRY